MSNKREVGRYYPIEKILKTRTTNGKVEYLIKWLDYSSKCNSWQPKENVKRIQRRSGRIRNQAACGTLPTKILSRFENEMCLVKWANGKASMMKLSAREAYRVIVNSK